jgi:hypothetical protein
MIANAVVDRRNVLLAGTTIATASVQRNNWLPAPKGSDFSLCAYWPKTAVIEGSWTPPAVQRAG